MTTSWILIANASQAKIYKTARVKLFNGDGALELVAEFGHPQSRQKNADLTADRSGKFQGQNTGSGTFNEAAVPKKVEADQFAKELIKKLNEGRNKNSYQDLIVVASPQFHGILNKHMQGPLEQMVSVNIEKDYTKIAEHDLLKQLQEYL